MKFPYGLADFEKLITQNYYYADRTQYINLLEDEADHALFLRPRRFGKSLLLGMLENYYDLRKTDKFTTLFGHLNIGQNPTAKHNQYFIMRWDFSMIDGQGTIEQIKQAIHDHINARIHAFNLHYQDYLKQAIPLDNNNSVVF